MPSYLIDRSGAEEVELDRARLEQLRDGEGFWWLDIHEPQDEELALLGEVLAFHELAIEDATQFGQRPKLEEYDDFVFLVVFGAAPDEDDLVEVHCFYSERYLVTVRRDECPAFAEARERYARRPEHLEEPALVLYRVVDSLVDSFFPLLSDVDNFIDAIEEGIFSRPDQEQLRRVLLMKRRLCRSAQGDRSATRPRREPRRRSGRAARHVAGRRARLPRRLRPPHPAHGHDRRLPRPAHRAHRTHISRRSRTGSTTSRSSSR